MEIKEYKSLAERTMSHQWHIKEEDQELLHCAIGMVTEAQELLVATSKVNIDTVNIMEECADLFWYLSGFQRRYNDIDWEIVTVGAEANTYKQYVDIILESTIEVLDKFKKYAFYGKPIEANDLKSELLLTYGCCSDLLALAGYTVDDARRINIEKLSKRFPEKFNSHDAINRDLDTERKTLEGTL